VIFVTKKLKIQLLEAEMGVKNGSNIKVAHHNPECNGKFGQRKMSK
jgi:hypothetical protein